MRASRRLTQRAGGAMLRCSMGALRIATAVLLMMAGAVNGCAGIGMGIGGSCLAATGGAVRGVSKATDAQGTKDVAKTLDRTGGLLVYLGMVLLALLGMQITAAVYLLGDKRGGFVLLTGAAGLVVGGACIGLLYRLGGEPPSGGTVITLIGQCAISILAAFTGWRMRAVSTR
jgi:hypothetical protein